MLGEQNVENLSKPANPQVPTDPVAVPPLADASQTSQTQGSTGSADSDIDVTGFAGNIDAIMEKAQTGDTRPLDELVDEDTQGTLTQPGSQELDRATPMARSSTPVPIETSTVNQTSLSALELGLRIAHSSRVPLQELIPISNTSAGTSAVTIVQQEEDTASSVHNAPPLPTKALKSSSL